MDRGYSFDSIPHLLKKYGPRSVDLVFMDQKAGFWNISTWNPLQVFKCLVPSNHHCSHPLCGRWWGPHLVTQTGPAGNPLSQRSGFDGGAESAVRPGSDSGRQCAEARRSALHLALGQRKLLGYLSFYLYLYLYLSIYLSFCLSLTIYKYKWL